DQTKKKSGLGAGSGGGFFSIWGKEEKSSDTDIVANVGSSLSAGNDVSIKARESDVNIIGSHVAAGNDIALEAARDVNILPGAERYASEEKEKRSGIGIQFSSGNGLASIGIGYGSSKTETRQGAETNAASSLSAGRDVIITAGRDANLQAAQVEAGSTVDILAERDVNLLSAQDKTNYETMHEELFAGITATVSSQAAKAVGNAYDAAKKVGDGNAANSIAMATIAGINGKYAYDALTDGQKWNDGFQQSGPLLQTSIGIGFQYQKNSAEGSSSTPVPTTIRAGDTVIVEAGRDINAVGAQISAGYNADGTLSGGRGDIALIAGNDINLESAKATTENSSKNVSGGLSIDLLSPSISASFGQGKGNDKTVTNVNTHVTGSGTVYVNSGNDTNLRGATISGETVIADIGGDLNIESQLDTATANAKQVGASLGVGSNPSGLTGGLSGSYQTAKGDAAIVSEQSGIHAGEGGFDIKVDGNTKLKGGLITSEADPENNRLETGTLEFEDLDTHSKWKADTYGGGITGSGPIVSPPIKEGESETGKALSVISPGEIVITDPDNQKLNIDDLRRDTTDTNTSLPGIPDLQKLLSEQLKTQQLYDDAAAKAAKMIGDYASERYARASRSDDEAEMEFWKEGGNGPAILHAIAGGLLGGVTDFNGMLSGMAGGAMSAKLAPEIHKLVEQFVKDAGLTGSAADLMVKTITGSILQGLGAAAGGTGAAYAGNAYQNNYLTHEQRVKEIEELKACDGDQNCLQTIARAYHELNVSQENELIACKTKECVDAIVASLADSSETLSDDYQQLLKLSREAAESALTYQQINIVTGQKELGRDIEYAYFTAAFCEANPGDNCKRDGGLLYFGNQALLASAYGALGISKTGIGGPRVRDSKNPSESPEPNPAPTNGVGSLNDSVFAQVKARPNKEFSGDGIKKYSEMAGEPINTVQDLTNAIKSGKIDPSAIEIDYVVINGQRVIANTRTSTALTNAGVPQSNWNGVDRTGQVADAGSGTTYDQLVKNQIRRNQGNPIASSNW
ncbi:MAG: hemagglutinin repeat-containing protein, partial [Brucella intermedia]